MIALQFKLRQTQLLAHHSSLRTVFKRRRCYDCQPAQKSFSQQKETETEIIKSQKGLFCKGFRGIGNRERKKIPRKHNWENRLAIDLKQELSLLQSSINMWVPRTVACWTQKVVKWRKWCPWSSMAQVEKVLPCVYNGTEHVIWMSLKYVGEANSPPVTPVLLVLQFKSFYHKDSTLQEKLGLEYE